jgi:hypothetical protein
MVSIKMPSMVPPRNLRALALTLSKAEDVSGL